MRKRCKYKLRLLNKCFANVVYTYKPDNCKKNVSKKRTTPDKESLRR